MPIEIQKITLGEALLMLASCYRSGDQTIIEDQYCSISTIRSKLNTIRNPGIDFEDAPRDYIVGVGGIYIPDEKYPGGCVPLYRVLV